MRVVWSCHNHWSGRGSPPAIWWRSLNPSMCRTLSHKKYCLNENANRAHSRSNDDPLRCSRANPRACDCVTWRDRRHLAGEIKDPRDAEGILENPSGPKVTINMFTGERQKEPGLQRRRSLEDEREMGVMGSQAKKCQPRDAGVVRGLIPPQNLQKEPFLPTPWL